MRYIDIDPEKQPELVEGEPEPTWQTVAEVTGLHNPLFDKLLFAIGYEFTSNVYILQGDYLSIIDPGNDYLIYMELFRQGVRPTDIKKVALTHGHQDHCMGVVELFRGYPGYAKDLDVEVIMHEAGPEEFKEVLRDGGIRITEIRGGETINLSGFNLQAIHTPGHTIDGLCFYHPETGTLFTGDTVLPEAIADIDQGARGRFDHYLYSLRTLRRLEVAHVMPGHGGIAPLVGRRVINDTYEGLIRKIINEDTPWQAGASVLAQQGLLEEALFCTQKALAEKPDKLPALEIQAFVLNDLGRYEEAIAAFDRLLAAKPDHFYGRFGKATALMGAGRYDEAVQLFDYLLQLRPHDKELLINKGLALYLGGRQEEALDIPAFSEAFMAQLKEELQKQRPPQPASTTPQS